MLLDVHMYMDANTAMRYVIKLHYAVWVLCHYGLLSCYYAIMWLCYHDVMMSCVLALSGMVIVNTAMRCYKAPLCGMLSCCHDVFLLSKSFIVNTTMSCVINIDE